MPNVKSDGALHLIYFKKSILVHQQRLCTTAIKRDQSRSKPVRPFLAEQKQENKANVYIVLVDSKRRHFKARVFQMVLNTTIYPLRWALLVFRTMRERWYGSDKLYQNQSIAVGIYRANP